MNTRTYTSCEWIACACAAAALLISVTNLAVWHLDTAGTLTLALGLPAMAPNSALTIVCASSTLLLIFSGQLFSGSPSPLAKVITPAVGLLLLAVGVGYLAEAALHMRLGVNHLYLDSLLGRRRSMLACQGIPSILSGLIFLLLGFAFAQWCRSYRIVQTCLFGCLAVATTALLGHFYEIQSVLDLRLQDPLSGLSLHTAAAIACLCSAMLFSRPEESVVRLALARNPAGTVIRRFGIGALITLALFGLSGILHLPLDESYSPVLKEAASIALVAGLIAILWSTVRELERIERERRRVVAELERSREQLLFSQKLAKVAYWQWNLLTDKIHFSDDLFHLMGQAPQHDAISFSELLRAIHPEDRRKVTEIAYRSVAGHCFFSVDFRALRPDGEIVHLHSQAKIELDEKGLPWRLRGASLDVTDLKLAEVSARQAEERVRILLDKANEAVRVREDVLSIVSHDLKNPLTSANLGVQLLQRQLKTQAPALTRTANNIQRSIENMKSLIQGILDVSKIQSGTFAIDPASHETAELLVSMQEVMMPIARDRCIELNVTPAPHGKLKVDRDRLQQVLCNLVGNALKFTAKGGRVAVWCEADADRMLFHVKDNGPGIPADHLKKIFERNWQASSTAAEGNGLGLFIAKGIVDAHRGHIWVESEPGAGSCFHFAVPLALEGERDAAEGVETPLVHLGRGAVDVAEAITVAPLHADPHAIGDVELQA